MKNLLISGISGNVGKFVYKYAPDYGFNVVCGIDKNKFVVMDCPVYSSFDEVKENIDVLIDFSSDRLCRDAISFAQKNGCAFLTGTTALSRNTILEIGKAAEDIPACRAANFSQAMIVMKKLSKIACKLLDNFDCEIIEAHNRNKKDAPSGTAKVLSSVCRTEKIHSLRGGNIAGLHTLCLLGEGEELTITHRAYDKSVFAVGALKAAKILQTKTNGFFTAEDLFMSDN